MADTATAAKTLTPEQADDLIGKVGTVKSPSKPDAWQGDYKVVGYTLATDDDGKVATLKLESVQREVGVAQMVGGRRVGPALMVKPGEEAGRPVVTPERPFAKAHAVPWRWFTPKADKVDNKFEAKKPEVKDPK